MDRSAVFLPGIENAESRVVAGDLTLEFSASEMTVLVRVGARQLRHTSKLWSHTAFELENLSEGLNYLVADKLARYIEVPSKDMLIGPQVGLVPSLTFEIGHPGIGQPGSGVIGYCNRRMPHRLRRDLIYVGFFYEFMAVRLAFEIDDVARCAGELNEQARSFTLRFIE